MGILDIPNELLLLVVEDLSIEDLNHLLSTCRRLSLLLTPRLQDLGIQDRGEVTALQWAAERGHATLAELAISRGARIDKRDRKDNRTPLHLAAFRNHPAVIRILVEHGARIGALDRNHDTPLHLAASHRDPEPARVLLELGADLNCENRRWQTPAFIAASRSVESMEVFVAAGFDLATPGRNGQTVLHVATFSKNIMMLLYLLGRKEAKAVINARDRAGTTPLHIAVGDSKIVKLLLRHGANMDDNNGLFGNTSAHLAALGSRGADPESLRVLIDAGCDLTLRSRHDATVLHHAAEFLNNQDVMEHLLKQPSTELIINSSDAIGMTPLGRAASREPSPRRARVLDLLVRYGADKEIQDCLGHTLADILAGRFRPPRRPAYDDSSFHNWWSTDSFNLPWP